MSASIEHVDLRSAPDSVLRGLYELEVEKRRVFAPDDPPQPFAWFEAEWRSESKFWEGQHWVLEEGGKIVGMAGAEMDKVHNLDLADAWVFVDEEARGRGHGRSLATVLFDWMEANGRVRPIFHLREGSEFDELARRAGLRDVLRMRRSRLLMSDVDRELMTSWVEKAAERAGDYELLLIETPVPEEHLAAMANVNEIMNDAPFEDLHREDEKTTPEMWRDLEQVLANRGDKLMNVVARHKESGDFVGFTNLCYQSLLPEHAWIWNTGVHNEHRNKGLGRWIKAAMTLHVLDQYPAVERCDTQNAGTNRPMLDINVTMGFRPLVVIVAWEGDLPVLREKLGV